MASARSVINRGYEAFASRLPGRVAARLDHLRPGYAMGWGGPFNGQQLRQEVFVELCRAIPFAAIVETGTFRGTTTEYMHQVSGLPIYSVESSGRFYHYARRRLSRYPQILVHQADSTKFLRTLSGEQPGLVSHPVLFYLDAHWYDYLPLADELEIITRHWRSPVILIDDFQIADDPGYGYDDYGAGNRLSIEYLSPTVLGGFEVFAPSAPASDDTGYRRGYAVLAPLSLCGAVRTISGLRPMPGLRLS